MNGYTIRKIPFIKDSESEINGKFLVQESNHRNTIVRFNLKLCKVFNTIEEAIKYVKEKDDTK